MIILIWKPLLVALRCLFMHTSGLSNLAQMNILRSYCVRGKSRFVDSNAILEENGRAKYLCLLAKTKGRTQSMV